MSDVMASPVHTGAAGMLCAGNNVLAACDLPPEARPRRRLGGWIRPRSVLGMPFSARRGDNLDEDIEQQAETGVANAASTGSESNGDSDLGGEIGQGGGINGRPADSTGIGWTTLASVVATQVSCLCIFGLVAGPTIRERVASSVELTFSSVGLGLLGATPLLIIGLALKAKHWAWVKKVDEITMYVTAQLFGTERQVVKVLALTIPLASLIGLAEELTFRGYVPLVLADLTGLPTAAVVGLSGLIFGVLHAATWAYFVNASLCGVYFHWLLLSTGNVFVPIVTHAAYDAFALLFCHLKVTRPSA